MQEEKKPWFRERFVWLVISLPASAIVAGIITIWIAISTSDGLVADDYYKQGLAINQTLARDEQARRLGLAAEVSFSLGQVTVSLSASEGSLPESVNLSLIHPTRGGEDQVISLEKGAEAYVGKFADMSAARWTIQIEDPARKWRMSGSADLPATGAIRMSAGERDP